jgi:hypothetical protein
MKLICQIIVGMNNMGSEVYLLENYEENKARMSKLTMGILDLKGRRTTDSLLMQAIILFTAIIKISLSTATEK